MEKNQQQQPEKYNGDDMRYAYWQGAFALKHAALDIVATLGGPVGSEGDDKIQAIYNALTSINLTQRANEYQNWIDQL